MSISHLLFADDLVLFGEANTKTLDTMSDTLDLFSHASGQTINFSKSKLLFSPNTSEATIQMFEAKLHYPHSPDLGTYLGFPLQHKKPSKNQLSFVVDKVRKKLASWKAAFLSKAGKICLIQSALSAIPCYNMQCFPIHKSIINEINS